MISPAVRGALVGGVIALVSWILIGFIAELSLSSSRGKLMLYFAAVLAPIVCVVVGAKIGSLLSIPQSKPDHKKK